MSTDPIRILVVDDRENLLSELARRLDQPTPRAVLAATPGATSMPASSRHQVRYLRTGDDAVREVSAAVAADRPFAVAFVDLQARIDGVETVARMWRHQPDLEVVLCTASSDDSWAEIVAKLPTTDQLVTLRKPFGLVEVRQLAACLSEKWRRGRALAQLPALEASIADCETKRTQKFDALGRLAAGIAHEINTPIQYIRSSVEFLGLALPGALRELERLHATEGTERTELGDLVTEIPLALADVNDGLERVANIVRAVRDYAQPSPHEKTTVDLNRQIQTVLELARNEYKQDADLVLALGEVPPVHGQADALGCAILNLVINAAHAVRDARSNGMSRGTITITTRVDAGFVVIDVTDTGTGIPETVRNQIFSPFFTTKPVGHGTGQGLALVRATVDGHRGRLTFDSEPGRGTTVHLALPIATEQTS